GNNASPEGSIPMTGSSFPAGVGRGTCLPAGRSMDPPSTTTGDDDIGFIARRAAILLALLSWTGSPLYALTDQTLCLQPGSALWLVGDSTLHSFTSRTTQLLVTAQLDPRSIASAASEGQALAAVLQRGALKQLDITVPVKTLKSGESGLDK